MNTATMHEGWVTANQRCLMAELAVLIAWLEPSSDSTRSDDAVAQQSLREARAAMPAPAALDSLYELFGLSPFERSLLLLCAGVELDGEFSRRCARAWASGGNPWPSFGLALSCIPDAHWDALTSTAPLRRWRMIEINSGSGLVAAPLRIDERILFYLTGVSSIDERLTGFVCPLRQSSELTPSQTTVVDRLEGAWSKAFQARSIPPVLQLCGVDFSAKRSLAAHVAERLHLVMWSVPAACLPANLNELETLHRLWEREVILQNGALLIECDRLENPDATCEQAVDRWIELSRTPLLISAREPRRNLGRPDVTVEIEKPNRLEQRLIWEQALGARGSELNGQLDRIISQFDFSVTTIQTAAGGVVGTTDAPEEFGRSLWETCRLQARPRLEALAQRIPSSATWSDLVLPAPQLQTLRDIALQVRQRAKVCNEWGFADQSSRGLGLSALFCGPSGTGKTLAAEILATEMRLDLYRIDLSAVVSKYIGETEKNLRRVFDAAEAGGAVLLFDEADALFGKRSEVKDSHDRYANVEVSYLLQRMEAYRGLAILTTNMKEALDPAFLRRLRFVVTFPFPDQAQRAEIWRRIFPRKTPTDRLDAGALSRLSISGGNIRSIALNAAFAAADAGEPVRMHHLLRAVRTEYDKLEKPLTEAEIGGWK
ncbi:MAG: ATP-binding protein [Verrucomicrobiia bacterium]